MKNITVLRLGHRTARDKRISTHCGLVARALGAQKIVYCGERDDSLIESVRKVVEKWGGKFKALPAGNWKKWLVARKKSGALIVHLTMYGLPFEDKIVEIKQTLKEKPKREIVVVVGAEKVPGEVYKLANYNLGVTNQPHSEVAALAIFLFALVEKQAPTFGGAKLKIVPQERGKKVIGKRRSKKI